MTTETAQIVHIRNNVLSMYHILGCMATLKMSGTWRISLYCEYTKDIFRILLITSMHLGINIADVIKHKMDINKTNYPLNQVKKGDESKYTKYSKVDDENNKNNNKMVQLEKEMKPNRALIFNKATMELTSNHFNTLKKEIKCLMKTIDTFSMERGWQQDYTIANLLFCIGSEVGELSDIIRFMNDTTKLTTLNKQNQAAMVLEIADIVIFVIRLFSTLTTDADQMISSVIDELTLNLSQIQIGA